MKVELVGKQIVSYTKKQTGELKEGLSLFYNAAKSGVDGKCCDNIWIRKGTLLYDRFVSQDFGKPLTADVVYEVAPGSRFPVLSDVKIIT